MKNKYLTDPFNHPSEERDVRFLKAGLYLSELLSGSQQILMLMVYIYSVNKLWLVSPFYRDLLKNFVYNMKECAKWEIYGETDEDKKN